ncbi:PEP-CTERM sorting domain-containing protein [Adhaeretor mobilis]|uniref:PEP-CTERM motif protein n=1 Tax=Adhaeretor mobilis TaxID=1930276 RepID=A0A517MZB3_9BACT|nr:PEP-CTERM sorting domain-containing protein [Adhaeretor mobilis]QDT00220.1 PEP-CTERM motif protein [Adhaeretor mobilis]
MNSQELCCAATEDDSLSNSKWKSIKRTAAYSLAAGAANVGLSSDVEAAPVYSGIQNIAIGQLGAQDLNLDGDAYNDVLLKNYVFGGNYQGATVNYAPGQLVGFNAGLNYVSALSIGDPIDGTTVGPSFTGSMAYGNNANSQFDSVTDAYIGLSFPINAVNHFGWVRVDVDNAAGTFLIKDWAYEAEPGVGIAAGQIPEPSTLGLLAAGALGLTAMRRRSQPNA